MTTKKRNIGLWVREAKSGKKFMGGTLAPGVFINVFKNDKQKENQPDYNIVLPEGYDIMPIDKSKSDENVANNTIDLPEVDDNDEIPF